jgi:hypothetical protein
VSCEIVLFFASLKFHASFSEKCLEFLPVGQRRLSAGFCGAQSTGSCAPDDGLAQGFAGCDRSGEGSVEGFAGNGEPVGFGYQVDVDAAENYDAHVILCPVN